MLTKLYLENLTNQETNTTTLPGLRRIERILCLVFCLALGFCVPALEAQQGIVPIKPSTAVPSSTAKSVAGSATPDLNGGNGINYHGGPVMVQPHNVYYIWYGNWTGDSALTVLPQFMSALNGSAYFNANTSYWSTGNAGIVNTVTLANQVFDNYSQGKSLTDALVQTVVARQISLRALPADPNGIYFVLASVDVSEGGFCSSFCGWHNQGTISGLNIKYAFVGDTARCPSACQEQNVGPNGGGGADGMTSVMAHELNETVTDPDLNAWFDQDGEEVGDKCAWNFGSTFAAPNGASANITLGGKPYFIQQDWLNAAGGSCTMSFAPALTSFFGGGDEHTFYLGFDLHVHELYYNGAWWGNDLTADTHSVNAAAGSALTSFFGDGIEHVFFVGADQHVHELYYNGAWWGNDLTAVTGSPAAASGSALTSFAAGNTSHVFFLSSDQHVRELYYNGAWWGNDLTAVTKSQVASVGSALTSFFANTEHVYFVGTDQDVHELYYNGAWWGNDLTAVTKTTKPILGTALSSFFDGAVTHVFSIGVDQHVHELYYNGAWWGNDLTAVTGSPNASVGSALTSFFANTEHVYFVGADQDVHELYYNGAWWGNDLTAVTRTSKPAAGTALTCFFDGTVTHVFALGSDQHVHEFYYIGGWWTNDLTVVSNTPVAIP